VLARFECWWKTICNSEASRLCCHVSIPNLCLFLPDPFLVSLARICIGRVEHVVMSSGYFYELVSTFIANNIVVP
jgi:hypothetical protein